MGERDAPLPSSLPIPRFFTAFPGALCPLPIGSVSWGGGSGGNGWLSLKRGKEWSAEQERLRRSVDFAMWWERSTQASLDPPRPWCSGRGLPGGVRRTPPPLGSCPQSLRAEEEVLNSQEGAWLGPRPLWGQLPGSVKRLGRTPKTRRCYKCPPTSQIFCPQQDPWQGRQPPPPHPTGWKSLNSGLRKVFVQLVTQDPPEPPHTVGPQRTWETGAGHSVSPPGPKLGLRVPHSWGRPFV